MYSEAGCMSTEVMTGLTGKIFAWAGFKYFDIRQSSRIKISVRGNAEGEMLVQDEKDGEIRAVIPVRPSADWQEESGEFHIEPGVHALYFIYKGSGSMDWQWFEFC